MNTLLLAWTLTTTAVFAWGLAHAFFPEAVGRRWNRGRPVDVEQRWRMQVRGGAAIGIGFLLCWILVEGGGLLRWMQ